MEELSKNNPEEAEARRKANEELEEAMSGRATKERREELNKIANARLQATERKIKDIQKNLEAVAITLDSQERMKVRIDNNHEEAGTALAMKRSNTAILVERKSNGQKIEAAKEEVEKTEKEYNITKKESNKAEEGIKKLEEEKMTRRMPPIIASSRLAR